MMSPINITIPEPRRTMSYEDSSPDTSPRGSPNGNGLTGQPIKEGNVYAIHTLGGKTVRVPVVLKVYSSSFEHYAVVSQDNAISRDKGYINLKHCRVQSSTEIQCACPLRQDSDNGNVSTPLSPSTRSATVSSPLRVPSSPARSPRHRPASNDSHTFRIIPNNAEGHMLTFAVCSPTEYEQWLSVLQRSTSDNLESSSPPRVVVLAGSPLRKSLGEMSSLRMASPQLSKRTVMPALEEE